MPDSPLKNEAWLYTATRVLDFGLRWEAEENIEHCNTSAV